MNFPFPASSKKWSVDVHDQSLGEARWLPPFSKVVAPSRAPLPLQPLSMSNAPIRVLERVEGRWL